MIRMTDITPENLIRHELIGLRCKIVHAVNPSLIGIEGTVVNETKNMIVIQNDKEREIPKKEVTFQFVLDKPVEIEGKALIGRPEDRVKLYGHRHRRKST